ncbi:ComEC/Rec2 family competence protein [Pseudoalteromonas peptidolytica]|uniref:Competence protein ComEC n=1 Tax=Pseudoalteromonas peptidolytica F12-50-A1 TaxID=1315280 RepID=A0A8I0MSY0_9GAMM|nr:hypothetical protein [Pseudoalteromonas peptidolytica]MBE0344858.1 hypothetical protein [Pseudoalteromonas peptidolytica F12-50-A1]NLR16764.1 hypothetical protein [Pseudoalteromonas peptidolytica]GEK09024.1 hypothetical protein PPE03_12730 [Pseudoalteromonas peptidolytica]
MTLKKRVTRFRAYQLKNAGSSFSYFNGTSFTLIEARYNECNESSINEELKLCGVNTIHTLHITSWDQDHCSRPELERILARYSPSKIEYPGYKPHTASGEECLKLIKKFKAGDNTKKVISVTPKYISSLDAAKSYGYKDILSHPKLIDEKNANNNSTVKHFRSGSFNVLSLGDVECCNIAAGLRRQKVIKNETDIMILAHHGANNGFTTSSFIRAVKPRVAIASANYSNKFEHPKREIRNLLHKHGVKLFTTKTGDVIICSVGNHTGDYRVTNLKADSSAISSSYDFYARKSKILKHNLDTIRAKISKRNGKPQLKK